MPRKVHGRGFFSKISTFKTAPSDKKSNCRKCAEECQMSIKCLFFFCPREFVLPSFKSDKNEEEFNNSGLTVHTFCKNV